MSHTTDPCECWKALGCGGTAALYPKTNSSGGLQTATSASFLHWSHHGDSTVLSISGVLCLSAIAMPLRVMEMASPGQCDVHLTHAEDDVLCNWPPHSHRHVIAMHACR